MPKSLIFNLANMSIDAIRENKIIVKISEFTVVAMPRYERQTFSNTIGLWYVAFKM